MCRTGGCGHFNALGRTQFVIPDRQAKVPDRQVPSHGVFIDAKGQPVKLPAEGNTLKAKLAREHGAVFSLEDANQWVEKLAGQRDSGIARDPKLMGEIETCGLPRRNPPGLDIHVEQSAQAR